MLIPKVLVVNDDPGNLLAMQSILVSRPGQHDYQLLTAASGEEALRQVLKNDFAVILLDVNMPGMDGFETAELIHSHPGSATVPIIFVTAHFEDEMRRLQAYQKGAVDYVFTPVIPKILQAKVLVFVELAKQKMELQAKAQELARLNHYLQVQRIEDLERINAKLQAEIIERKQAEQRAHELATRDALTGVLNRRSLIEHLEHAIAHADRRKEIFALLFMDMDRFKSVNDTLGHDVGDEFLIQVARRIKMHVRQADIVARFGGDEFVVLLEDLAEPEEAFTVAKKIAASITSVYEIGAHSITTSASIGISVYPQDGASVQGLMKNADVAMYQAKAQGRGNIEFFQEKLTSTP